MKNLFTIFVILAVSLSAMGQKSLPKNTIEAPLKIEKAEYRNAADAKEIFLYQSFDEFPGEGWTTTVSVPTHTWTSGPNMLNSQGDVVVAGFAGDFAYCQWQATTIQDEWMISPSIDLSGLVINNPLVLDFYWFGHNQWSSNCDLNVLISTDGGSNWTLLWNESNAQAGWSTYTWYYASINLQSYLGESDVKIGIQYFGNDGAQFGIDEIRIYEQLNHEIRLSAIGMANMNLGYYSQLPIAQINENSGIIFFEAPIENIGSSPQTNVKLNVNISKGEENLFTTTSSQVIASFPSFGKDTLRIGFRDPDEGTTLFTYPEEIGAYNINFEVIQDEEDQNPANNQSSTIFKATSRTLARYTNTSHTVGIKNYLGNSNGDFLGVTFALTQDEVLESMSVYLSDGTTYGENALLFCLYVATQSGLVIVPGTCNPQVDIVDIEDESMPGSWVTYTFANPITLPAVTDGSQNFYVMGVNSYLGDMETDKINFFADKSFKHWTNVSSRLKQGEEWASIEYVPAFVANFVRPFRSLTFEVNDHLGEPINNATVTLNGKTYPESQYNFSLMEDTYYYTVALGGYSTSGTIEFLNENMTVPVVITTVKAENINLEKFVVYPNPFNDNLRIQFNSAFTDNYTIRLVSLNGQNIFDDRINGFSGEFNKEYNFGAVAKGVYYLQVISSQGSFIQKLVKQ